MDNKTEIDFNFISRLEGSSLKGYVPDPLGSQSGVTIASGFDIGQHSNHEILNAFSPDLATKLLPYSGLTKMEAYNFNKKRPLEITNDECVQINKYAHETAEAKLKSAWDHSNPLDSYDNLPGPCKTVVASISFQYGNLALRTPNFWAQVISLDWEGALGNLRNFGDKYQTRRNKEADLLQHWMLARGCHLMKIYLKVNISHNNDPNYVAYTDKETAISDAKKEVKELQEKSGSETEILDAWLFYGEYGECEYVYVEEIEFKLSRGIG